MAQIDREEGNQSALGEALNSYNHSHTFRKKKKGRKIPNLLTLSNNHVNVEGKGGRIEAGQTKRHNKEELEHGVGKDFSENAFTHCSDNNILAAQA